MLQFCPLKMNKRTSDPGSSSSVVHVVCPERDLATNWEVDLAKELKDNLLKICSGTITVQDEARIQVNFSEGEVYLAFFNLGDVKTVIITAKIADVVEVLPGGTLNGIKGRELWSGKLIDTTAIHGILSAEVERH